MVLLSAAVSVVAALCLLDLLLTLGVIRRLREQTGLGPAGMLPEMPVIGLAPMSPVAPFSAVTMTGGLVSGGSGLRLAAFFSTSCSACQERVGPFADYVTGHRIPPDSVLSVIVGTGSAPPPYLDRLAGAGQVCLAPDDGELVSAFEVRGFPAFCLLDADGTVLASGYDPAALPAPAAVR